MNVIWVMDSIYPIHISFPKLNKDEINLRVGLDPTRGLMHEIVGDRRCRSRLH
jgi:hypothetical protein